MSNLRNIAPDVVLGQNVRLNDFVNLYGCEIGDESMIGTFVEIQRGAKIGRRVKLQSHTFVCTGVEIQDEAMVGHGVSRSESEIEQKLVGHRSDTRGQRPAGQALWYKPGKSITDLKGLLTQNGEGVIEYLS